jgi:hypothetical protein
MDQKYLPLLDAFAVSAIIHRSLENDALFIPLVEGGLVYATLGHGWRLSETGRLALTSYLAHRHPTDGPPKESGGN